MSWRHGVCLGRTTAHAEYAGTRSGVQLHGINKVYCFTKYILKCSWPPAWASAPRLPLGLEPLCWGTLSPAPPQPRAQANIPLVKTPAHPALPASPSSGFNSPPSLGLLGGSPLPGSPPGPAPLRGCTSWSSLGPSLSPQCRVWTRGGRVPAPLEPPCFSRLEVGLKFRQKARHCP